MTRKLSCSYLLRTLDPVCKYAHMTRTRTELAHDERFQLWGHKITVMTFQARRGEIDWDTNVSLRTSRRYVGTVRVSQLAEVSNVVSARKMWVKSA